ncbi:MAG TPA: hypothetical protein VD771_07535 [Gemmatimonadaceae bacterium]|nr:hypothetical protein [Gemmatimonadaceae bacterium]
MKARLAIFATMCAVAVLNACGDPTNLKATLPTVTDTLSLFALSGTPPSYPSGISLLGRTAVRVDGFANFDVAFDINGSGNVVVYPVKLVVASPGGSRPVGLLRAAGSFETVLEAPATGYQTDASIVLAPGETVVLQSAHNSSQDVCQFALSPYLYAKIGVDSVNLASRTIYLQMGLDPNCGFRSFVSGIPTS